MENAPTLGYQPSVRPAPPTGRPPLYARTVQRVFPYSLRPVVLITCLISLIYLVVLGINDFRDAGNGSVSSKLKTFEIVQGILFLAAGVVELFGFFAAYTQRLPLARIYSFASLIAFAAVIASEILGIIVSYTLKSDVLSSCTTYYTGTRAGSGSIFSGLDDSDTPMTQTQATDYCNRLYNSNRTWDIIWLIITLILGAAFVAFSFAYVRQLLDPTSVKVRISRFQQQHGPQPHHGMQGPYDPDAAFSYPPQSGGYPPYGAYAPPSGPPPPMGSGAPPGYSGRDGSMDGYDGDAKTPADYGYGYNYAQNPFNNRPGSSRGVAMHQDDDASKRDSGETLRGEESVKQVDSSTQGHGRRDDDHDNTPRI